MSTQPASSEFRRYIEENEALPEDCVLGHIVWYSVAEANYDPRVLEQEFLRLGLNLGFLPGPINPADAYEKAAKIIHGEKYDLGGGLTAEILIREASRDNYTIVRKMIREVKDSSRKRLSYEEVGEFVFYRPTTDSKGVVNHRSARVRSTLSIPGEDVPGTSPERPMLEAAVAKFDQAYYSFSNFHDGQRVRAIVRGYLQFLSAILMKNSVYFVHNSRVDELRRLQEFVNLINPGSGTSITLLPLADLPSLRSEVTEAFQREAVSDLESVVVDIQKLYATRKGAISNTQYARMHARYSEVVNKASEYARTLQVTQDQTGAAAELAYHALIDLQKRVVEGMTQ